MPTTLSLRSRISTDFKVDGSDTTWSANNLLIVASFCAIGLMITANLILRFPDLGGLIEQYNQF